MIFSVPRETTWFELTARENFERFLLPQAEEYRHFLQLGCFTGDATVWLMDHLNGEVDDVDTFEGSDEHAGLIDFDLVMEDYDRKTQTYGNRVITHEMETEQFLANVYNPCTQYWDFIYVDADHHAKEVLRDAVMAWPLLKKGGLMAFDDYEWGQGMPALDTPRPGIDAFLTVYSPEIVVKNAQCWVRKG